MIHQEYPIRTEGALPGAGLTVYLQDDCDIIDIHSRPLVLVCPGGGYEFVAEREGEAIALQFLAMGYHAAVLRYSVAPAVYPAALLQLAYSVNLIRQNAEQWHVHPGQIIVLGCSAGGHLAASLGVFWDEDFLAEALGLSGGEHRMLRPDGMILCYPVITSGEFAHRPSFRNLLGPREELTARMSLENQVRGDTPPAFVWHTYTDNAVPVENSLLLVAALRRAGVSAEFHMYPCGVHGLALANRLTQPPGGSAIQEECTSWIPLVHSWIEHQYVAKS